MKKLSVIAPSNFNDFDLLKKELDKEEVDVMVVGGKLGADDLAREYALTEEIPIQVFLPDYRKHGRSANYFRNLEMIDNSSMILIFWDGYRKSPFKYIEYIKDKKISFRTVIY